jgi:hypothetical protein
MMPNLSPSFESIVRYEPPRLSGTGPWWKPVTVVQLVPVRVRVRVRVGDTFVQLVPENRRTPV